MWAKIVSQAPKAKPIPNNSKNTSTKELDVVEFTEEQTELNFMDLYGYKISLLWENLKNDVEMNPSLLCKTTSSLKLQEFLYENISFTSEQLGIFEEDTEDSTHSDDYIE